MTIIESPGRVDLVRRATDLVSLIRTHAPWQDEERRLHEEVVQAIYDVGLLKLRVPLRYGGYEADMRTVVEVITELARGDGSVGWVFNAWMNGCWLAGLFPDEAQDEIFSDPNGLAIGNSVSPTGIAVPTKGGVILNGKWAFCSGVLHGPWFVHSAILAAEDGDQVPVVIAVPRSDLTVIDDWHTMGLRATGSVTTIAEDVFIPETRVLPILPVLMENKHLSVQNANSLVWKGLFSPVASAAGCASSLGMAQAAWEIFFERLPDRKISFTNYESQLAAPVTHMQVAQAAIKIDQAEFHLHRLADRVDSKAASGERWTMRERALSRMDMGATTMLAKEAVDILLTASGGSSNFSHVPMQRIERDVLAINLHGVLHPDTNLELYGRVLCGLEPNTHLI